MGCFVRGDKNSMGCYVRGDKNSMGCFVRGGKSLWDVLSGVAKNGMGCFVPGCFVWHPVRLEEALAVADPEGVQGFVRTPLPRPQSLNISETKLFHFHGIFKQIDIKSAKRTPSSTELIPLPEILDHPCLDLFSKNPGSAPA